ALLVFFALDATAYGQTRVSQFTTNSVHPHSITVNYPAEECTVISTSYSVSAGGNTLNFSAGSASPFQIIRQEVSADCSITADFPPNTKALAVNTITKGTRPALTLTFSVPVTEM